jgi:ParB family chromosome partitioning protein
MIPIDLIVVLNTRERKKGVFDEIVGNIKAIGLKKPITVTPRSGSDGTERYMLICGEGRLKAFQALGEKAIPVLISQTN